MQVLSKRENPPHQADFEARERETGLEPAPACLEVMEGTFRA